jgi:outer membrane receptor protein involved in Fe transport
MWSTQATADGSDTELAEWPSELIFNAGVGLRPDKSDRLIIDLGCNNLTDTARTLVNPHA